MSGARLTAGGEAATASRMPAEGHALRMLRQHRELTQSQLAEISGVSRAAISDFERGEREPGPESLKRLLGALEMPERAWEDTVRHLEWIEWLGARGHRNNGLGVAGAVGPEGSDRDRVIERVAESACRDLERHVVDILSLVTLPRR